MVSTSTEIIDAIDEYLAPNDRRILGKYGGKVAGVVAAGGEVYYNQVEYDNGKISGYRFTYRLGKTASTIVIGSSVGGPKGVALGILVGVTFDMMEKAWDTIVPQLQQGYDNFINTTTAHWMRYK